MCVLICFAVRVSLLRARVSFALLVRGARVACVPRLRLRHSVLRMPLYIPFGKHTVLGVVSECSRMRAVTAQESFGGFHTNTGCVKGNVPLAAELVLGQNAQGRFTITVHARH